MNHDDINSLDPNWLAIERELPEGWRELAEPNGVRLDLRPECDDKIKDLAVALRLMLHHVCTGSSLEITTSLAAALGVIQISAVALHKWMRKCGDWMAAIATAMAGYNARFAASLWAGFEVIAADATTVMRPGGKQTTARVHFALRLADLRAVAIKVTGPEVGETLRNFEIRKRQLWLLDRGYCNANSIAHAVRHGGHVVIRFCVGPLPLFKKDGTSIDARALMLEMTRPGRISSHRVNVRTDEGLIPGRLLISRLPDAEVEKARRRLVKERGKKHVKADAEQQAAYVMIFTTVPKDVLTGKQVMQLYRLRWQVELSFKRDKSIAGLDKLPNFRADTIHTWICTMMVGRQLAQRLAGGEPFPPSVIGEYALRPTITALLAARTRA